jgi:hypothetical protein
MRVAVVLGTLAKLLDNVIFQPTYLLPEDSELREVLYHEATHNASKERYTRGILLSMWTERQEDNCRSGISFIITELFEYVDVGVLLPVEAVPAFRDAVQDIVMQFQGTWKIIQQGRGKLEPSFDYSTSTEFAWHVLHIPIAAAQEVRQTEAHPSASGVEDDTVIIPRIYAIGTEAGPTPVTHGCVLRKSDLDAAKDEVRQVPQRAAFARMPSNRRRNRLSRDLPVTGAAATNGRRGDHFLSEAHGAPDS